MTTTELSINYGSLDKLFYAMNEVGDQSRDLSAYFRANVCNTSGFDYASCALQPIAAVLPQMAGWFDEAMSGFGDSWVAAQHAIYASARHLEQQDDLVRHDLDSYQGPGGQCDYNPPGPDYIENFHVKPLSGALTAPEGGESQLDHDSQFDAAAEAWDTGRDLINDGIDLLNQLGAGLAPLSDKSLRDYIVYPLAANYEAIGADANACVVMDAGFDAWGDNFGQLAAKTPQAMTGQTGLAVVGVFTAYDVAMHAIGDVVSNGRLVFQYVARVSEKIAVEVEKVLVLLGTKITELAAKVGKRVIPLVGELIMAFDLIKDTFGGDPLDQFQDIIDDIGTVRRIIEDCFDLVDTIKAWAETQGERLERFHDVLDTLSGLPGVGGTPGLSDLSHGVGNIEHTLDGINYGGDASTEKGQLDGELGGLDGEAESEGESLTNGDLSDGEITDGPEAFGPPGGGAYA